MGLAREILVFSDLTIFPSAEIIPAGAASVKKLRSSKMSQRGRDRKEYGNRIAAKTRDPGEFLLK
jgi:hypothetical protein